MAYLNVIEVESAMQALSAAYPGQCERIALPNATHEGRACHAIRIGNGPLDNRPSVLYIGGQHAREWGSCEICINVATDLLEAYTLNTGLAYGGKTFTAPQVQNLVNGVQLFIFPCVNPDGRNHSQNVASQWRGNRNPVYPAQGVDINRNYDFMWDYRTAFSPAADLSHISDNPNSQTFHGPAPESEPETRNVVYLLDTYPQIRWMIDIHSYSELLYHNWGDDQNQTTNPAMNFLNPAYNGLRGVEGDAAYREYIPADDLAAEACLTGRMQAALQEVRGRNYSTGQGFELYPTSGTAKDYPYSRHFADPAKTKTLGFLIEWGTSFQPTWTEMENIILDISSALVEFAIAAPCQCAIAGSACQCPTVDAQLLTPSVTFMDVPENEQTARAVVFSVNTCQAANFQVVAGPAVVAGPGSFGTLPSPTAALPAVGTIATRQSRLWLSFTGTNDGDSTMGTVTVRLLETGEEWVVPITANTIARPTVATVLVLDQSGSMDFASGLPALPRRNDVLQYAAPVFCNLLHENNGIGIVAFDHDAFDRMTVQTVGAPGPFDPVRATALGVISGHTPNPAGATAIGDGVERGNNLLLAAGGYDHRAMLVFTDGHETAEKYIADVAPLINDRVFAIGLGTADQIQPAALTALTNNTGGFLLLTGALGPEDLFRLSKYYLQILAGITNQDIVLDPEGSVLPGQVHRIPFHLSEADIGIDTILLSEAKIPVFKFALETPAGDLIDPAMAAGVPSMDFVSASAVSFYRMTLPVPVGVAGAGAGKWHAVLTLDPTGWKRYLTTLSNRKEGDWKSYQRVKTHGVRYSLSVQAFSGLRMQARLLQTSQEPGAILTLRAVLTEYGLPISKERASVWAEFKQPDGTSGILGLAETGTGTGIYTAQLTTSLPGVYHFRVLSSGKTFRGRDFTREHLLTGGVWKGGDTPPPRGSGGSGGTGTEGHECLCKLLRCLLGRQVIRPEFEKRLIDLGIDLGGIRSCLKECC